MRKWTRACDSFLKKEILTNPSVAIGKTGFPESRRDFQDATLPSLSWYQHKALDLCIQRELKDYTRCEMACYRGV